MVKIMENPIKNGMIWGEKKQLFSETSIHIPLLLRHVGGEEFPAVNRLFDPPKNSTF